MRGFPAAMVAAFEARVAYPAIFYEGQFADGWLRLWSGLGEIEWGGRVWTGAGTLLGFGAVEETLQTVAKGGTVDLSAVPLDVMQLALAQAVQGAPGRVYLGAVNPPQRNFARGSSAVEDTGLWPATSSGGGITMTTTARGWDEGLPFVELRYVGTPTSTFFIGGYPSNTAGTMTLSGRWTLSAMVKQVAGELSSGRFRLRIQDLGSGTSWSLQPDTPEYSLKSVTRQMVNNQLTARFGLEGYTPGVPIDVTYRVAGLQLEPGGQRTEYQPYGADLWTPLVSDPVLLFGGRLDVPSWTRGEATANLQVAYESRLIDLLNPRELRYTHESHQLFFPGDRCFEYVTSIQDKVPSWGQ